MTQRLIIGLGNPGTQYQWTRHNIGFLCVAAFAEAHSQTLKFENRFNANVVRFKMGSTSVTVAQPLTYMNLSGESAQKLMHYYDIDTEDVLIVYDDIDLPFGRIRFRPSGSAGSHNGMKSIVQHAGTQAIARLRVGISAQHPEQDLADYVLATWTPTEKAVLQKIVSGVNAAITDWIAVGTEAAMNLHNGKTLWEPPPPVETTP